MKIVLSTIDELFDQLEADPKRAGSIRTLTYCKDAVEARYRTWKESMVGAPEGASGSEAGEPESTQETGSAPDRLTGLSERLEELIPQFDVEIREAITSAKEAIDRLRSSAGEPAEIEEQLDRLDESIDEALFRAADDKEVKRMRESALWELGERASLMDKEVLERTTGLIVKKELRRASGIPGLGLFRL